MTKLWKHSLRKGFIMLKARKTGRKEERGRREEEGGKKEEKERKEGKHY